MICGIELLIEKSLYWWRIQKFWIALNEIFHDTFILLYYLLYYIMKKRILDKNPMRRKIRYDNDKVKEKLLSFIEMKLELFLTTSCACHIHNVQLIQLAVATMLLFRINH